jgi:hypothetical protein
MTEIKTLNGRGVHCVIGIQPVTRESYKRYLREMRKSIPHTLTLPASGVSPVIYASQASAREYCDWLSTQEGRRYRLPTMAELLMLYSEDPNRDAFGPDLWPHQSDNLSGVGSRGLSHVFLCEWSNEVEEVPQPDHRPARLLGSIFYPPWLREGVSLTQAYLQATEGYSFVTFRVAADLLPGAN